MATQAAPQPQGVPMFAPDGSVRLVPADQISDAQKAGGQLAHQMKAPDGSLRYVPHDQLGDALKAGGVPLSAAQSAQAQNAAAGQNIIRNGTVAMPEVTPDYIKSLALTAKGVGQSVLEASPLKSGYDALTTNPMERMRAAAQRGTGGNLIDAAKGLNPIVTDRATAQENAGGSITNVLALVGGLKTGANETGLTDAVGEKLAGMKEVALPSVEKLTNTTPARINELQSFPKQVEGVRQSVVAAEKQAHAAASAKFPKFDKPIETGRTVETVDTGLLDEKGQPITRDVENVHTTSWTDLQEQRSNLLKQIADEKRAVSRGAAPRFDLADMVGQLNKLDETMNSAALDQGGDAGLQQLKDARAQYGKYMQDFHNTGSPLRGIVEAKPGETAKVVRHLLNPDMGARALETLRGYGYDTSNIESMLGQGSKPLRVTTNEAAKLRRAGTTEAYQVQRIREALRQTKVNELPAGAEERLPAKNMSSKPPPFLKNIPVVDRFVTPRRIASRNLEKALLERRAKTP